MEISENIIDYPSKYQPGVLRGRFKMEEINGAADRDEFLGDGDIISTIEYSYARYIRNLKSYIMDNNYKGQQGAFVVTLVSIKGNEYEK